MNNKVKRIGSGFLVAAVITATMGVTAFAAEANPAGNQNNSAAPAAAASQQVNQPSTTPAAQQQTDQPYKEKAENIKDFQTRINAQNNAPAKTNLDQLFATYQSKVTATENAKKALVTELSKSNIKVNIDEVLNIGQIESEINKILDPATSNKLTKLLNTYKNAFAAEQSAKAALDAALSKAEKR